MTLDPNPRITGFTPRPVRRSLRRRQLALAVGLTLVPIVVVISVLLASTTTVIDQLQNITSQNLRTQAESYLVQINDSMAGENALILDQAARDVQAVAAAAASIYSGKVRLPDVSVGMIIGPERQVMNSGGDISSLFVPNTTWIDTDYNKALYEAVMRDIELSTYLDFTLPSVKENNPNAAAVYLGTVNNVLHYYPNVRLGELVPADFAVTQRPWFTSSLETNRGKEKPAPVWSPVYFDATGLGLVTTIAMPVITEAGELVGVAGLDVTLTEVQRNLENTRLLETGYSFLLDEQANAIILPEAGHRDIFGTAPDPDHPMPSMKDLDNPQMKAIVEQMMAGETGFRAINLGGREVYIAFSPLRPSAGSEATTPVWSLGSVVAVDDVLADVIGSGRELRRSVQLGVITRIVPIGIFVAFVLILAAFVVTNRMIRPILKVAGAAETLGAGDWESPLPLLSEVETANPDEIGRLAGTLRAMSTTLRESFGRLEQRVAERTQALEHRTLQMQTAAEVARDITLAQDIDSLLQDAVNLISLRFGYYNVGIFLIDETNEWANLKAASGALGKLLLEREIRFPVGHVGMVGYVTRFGQARRSDDVEAENIYVSEPLLSETRSEVTLPLRSGPKMIGALDVQSTELSAFNDDDVTVLQTLANQLATAIENVRLVSQMQATLDESNLNIRQHTRQAWTRLIRQTGNLEFEYDRLQVRPMTKNSPQAGLRVPVRLRDQLIGFIGLESEDPNHVWSADELAIIEATANQAALTVENARLLAESRRQAVREQITTDVTAKMRASLDMQTVLESAVREIAQQLSMAEVEIELTLDHQSELPDVTEIMAVESSDCNDDLPSTDEPETQQGLDVAVGTNGRIRRLRSLGRNRHGAR